MIQKCKKCGEKYKNIITKFCSIECAYSYSELDADSYLMLRIA